MGEQGKSMGRTLLSVSLEAIVSKSKCKRNTVSKLESGCSVADLAPPPFGRC